MVMSDLGSERLVRGSAAAEAALRARGHEPVHVVAVFARLVVADLERASGGERVELHVDGAVFVGERDTDAIPIGLVVALGDDVRDFEFRLFHGFSPSAPPRRRTTRRPEASLSDMRESERRAGSVFNKIEDLKRPSRGARRFRLARSTPGPAGLGERLAVGARSLFDFLRRVVEECWPVTTRAHRRRSASRALRLKRPET